MYGASKNVSSSWLDLLPSQLYYKGVSVAFSEGKSKKMANSDLKCRFRIRALSQI